MSYRNMFFVGTLILIGLILSACAPVATSQPTILPNPMATETMNLASTATEILSTGTSEQVSTITDATLQAQTKGAFEATKTLISSLPNKSQDEIVKMLFVKWLDYYKTDKVDPYFRLKDYKVEEISATGGYCPPPDKDTRKFTAQVQFSIQTVTAHPGDWVVLPGNIRLGADNWIYHIAPYVSISESNGNYIFIMEGSVPCG